MKKKNILENTNQKANPIPDHDLIRIEKEGQDIMKKKGKKGMRD